jgi:organic radical activating enzyme
MTRLNPSTLKVCEIFGPTWQGEGPSNGRLAWFVRAAECNQHCNWCDTAYTWAYTDRRAAQHQSGHKYDRAEEVRVLTVDQVRDQLLGLGLCDDGMLVISGGEPMLQQRGLAQLLVELRKTLPDLRVEVETAGTIKIDPTFASMVTHFNVSPKLAHSGNELALRYRPDVLKDHLAYSSSTRGRRWLVWNWLGRNRRRSPTSTAFKFVVQHEGDLDEIAVIQDEVGIPNRQMFVMPEGTDAVTITRRLQELYPAVLKRNWNLTSRLHIYVFGDKRGT